MGCLKLLNNSKLFAIAGGTKYQPLAVAYKREWLLDESINDAHGNMLSMPHLSSMQWDFEDRLKSATNGTFTSYYNYDSGGERSRKVVDKGNIREERYYIGGFEIFRKYVNNSLDTERTTLHVMDDTKTVALVETLTIENGTPCSPSVAEVRYQYDNHLGSACLELDEYADIISYEEYHPFGTTSYRSGRTEVDISLKRYKYVGKERDEETGLYYYGARYYAAWLCRFVSVDTLQHKYPHYTPFQYAGNKPISYIDLDGLEEFDPNLNKDFKVVFINIKPSDFTPLPEDTIPVQHQPKDSTTAIPQPKEESVKPKPSSKNDFVKFTGNAKSSHVSDYTKEILETAARKLGMSKVTVSSTKRSDVAQIKAMYSNILKTGAKYQLGVYGKKGKAVINAYTKAFEQGLNKDEIIKAMLDKAKEVGFLSTHTSPNYDKLNAVDVPMVGKNAKLFADEVKKLNNKIVTRLENGVVHIEIPQTTNQGQTTNQTNKTTNQQLKNNCFYNYFSPNANNSNMIKIPFISKTY